MAITKSWLTELIQEKGFTLEAIAQACGKTDATVSEWGKGYSIPPGYLDVVADVLEISVADLQARMNEAKLQDYNNPPLDKPVEEGIDTRGEKALCEKMQLALETLQRQDFKVLHIAEKAYPTLLLKGIPGERLTQLARHLFELVRNNENDHAYKYFFQGIVNRISEGSTLAPGNSRLKAIEAIEALLGVYVACYLNPQSFVENKEQKHLAVNVAGLESLEETTEYKPFFTELSFRVLSHQRFAAERPFRIRLDLSRQRLLSDGVNLRLGPMRSGDVQRQLHEFIRELASAISIEFRPPQRPAGDVIDNKALAVYQKQCVEYYGKIDHRVAEALKIGYLNRLVKRKTGAEHPLLYIIEQCSEQLISEIKTHFPSLPIYQFDKQGVSCFAVDLDLDVLSLGSFVQDLFQMIPYDTDTGNSKFTKQRIEYQVPNVSANTAMDKQNGIEEMTAMNPDKHLFICYASEDVLEVEQLKSMLQKKFSLSKQHRLQLWQDKLIPLGADWHETIQQALKECVYGLLMLSEDFLLSDYIEAHELPELLEEEKALPVALTMVDFKNSHMQGVDAKQCYFYQKGKKRLSFEECESKLDQKKFAQDLYEKILHRLQQG